MKSFIIGIAGAKNSGKDTIASMINYIFAVGITRATYGDYLIKKVKIDNTHADRIVHFADNMKDVMSIMFGIPRCVFDDRQKKDNAYWDYFNKTFVNFADVLRDDNAFIIYDIKELNNETSLADNIKYCIKDNRNLYIKIRTLMQYFGTDICRTFMDEDIWVRSAIVKIANIAATRRLCIIPDVRFANEAEAIHFVDSPLYGGVIKINRSNDDNLEHSSEIIDFTVDFEINNDGTLMQLFYKVLEICQTLI